MLLTLIPREICSLSSWTPRAIFGNLSGKSPATDWRAILLLRWRFFWHFPVQLKLFLELHGLNKTGGLIKNYTHCGPFLYKHMHLGLKNLFPFVN